MELIDRLNKAIDVEYDTQKSEFSEVSKMPVEERVLKGETITDITAKFIPLITRDGTIIFNRVETYCKTNISKFREGSPVILSGHGCEFKLEIMEDYGERMVLIVDYNYQAVSSNLNNTSGWQLDSANVDIRHIVKISTSLLQREPEKLRLINGIFKGEVLPTKSPGLLESGKQISKDLNLNTTQKEAFINAYSHEPYFLIQGPPGSGKTWLLAYLAIQYTKEGKKVLITAPTHTAINNALNLTSRISGFHDIIKVGKKHQAENLNYGGARIQNFSDLRESDYNNNSKGIIVGATCYSPHTNKMSFMDWDVIIIDEAGQLSIPLAFAAMVKGKKFILIGDHKQLPPIISDQHQDLTFSRSIFEHLHEFSPGIMLDTTYRMSSSINDFPSKHFYGGLLKPEKVNANWKLEIENEFVKHQDILDINKPEVLICHDNPTTDARSEFEADLIAEFVSAYISKGIQPKEIAVITPFRAQVRQIKTSLSKLNDYHNYKEDLFVDTVERIQGQEREIIFFSLALTDPVKAKQRAEFFFNPNRLNVALTRSKKKRIVLGNRKLFEIKTFNEDLYPLVEKFKDFYNESTKVFV